MLCVYACVSMFHFFFFKQKTAYEMRISDWSSDVCSSDLLMMFAQVNSEHCRHKIFNAEFTVDGETQPHSLFQMIKMTYAASPQGVLSAYKDNASRSEERRVGKEGGRKCRCRWRRIPSKKKTQEKS